MNSTRIKPGVIGNVGERSELHTANVLPSSTISMLENANIEKSN